MPEIRRGHQDQAVGTGAYLVAAVANFAYLDPILTAKVIPYSAWLSRIWFSNWI